MTNTIDSDVVRQYQQLRGRLWLENGRRPLPPIDCMPQWVIPAGKWIGENPQMLARLRSTIHSMDSNWLLLYDQLTTDNGLSPGYHLYRKFKGVLALEFSLQYDMQKDWPNGGPRAPGDWLISYLRSVDKASRIGDRNHVNADVTSERVHRMQEWDRIGQAKTKEQAEYLWREVIDPYWNKKRSSGLINPHYRRPADRKIFSYTGR